MSIWRDFRNGGGEPKSGEYEQQGETGVSKPCGKEPDDPQQRTGRLCDSDGWRSAVVCIYNFCAAYGNHLPLIVLLALCGGLAGLSVGIAIAVLVKSGDNVKTGIVISVTMAGCFLSGMMGITMKYLVDKNIPLLNLLNPANMITDGLYALYYYDTFDRYWQNAASLLVFAFSMILFSVLGLRRQKYDSI